MIPAHITRLITFAQTGQPAGYAASDMMRADLEAVLMPPERLTKVDVEPPPPPFGSKRKAAMAVYTPPFTYKYGYIYDSQNLMVADKGCLGEDELGVKGAVAARVRGWGRLGYLPNGAELQDEIGQMMADALNQLYSDPASALAALRQENETMREVLMQVVEAYPLGRVADAARTLLKVNND